MKHRHILASILFTVAAAMPAKAVERILASQLIAPFDRPVYVTGAPGVASKNLLFVVEQSGAIRVLENEVTLPTPFLNITPRITFGGEQGVLSIAFHPNYETSGLFYVAYTNRNGDLEIDEFRRSLTDVRKADPASRRRVIVVLHRDSNTHYGGQLAFGPDGFLYISTGYGGDFPESSADLGLLLGKLLRIDPTPNGPKAYTIPSDNPFVGMPTRRGEIYAYGLRNPWRFSIKGNLLAIGDVGEQAFEELNFLTLTGAKGVNFGYPQYEGKRIFDNTHPGPHPAKPPMYVYDHQAGRCAIIGGYIARDPGIPAIQSKYLFGDLCQGRIFTLVADIVGQKATEVRYTGLAASGLSSFGVGPGNRIYITQVNGSLSRLKAVP